MYWRYAVGAFHSPSDYVVLANAPVGTFSTGQHGPLAKHRRIIPVGVVNAFRDTQRLSRAEVLERVAARR